MSRTFQKLCPMSSTHWWYNSSWTSRRVIGSSVFCVQEEENSSSYALVWLVSTWLAHDMPEATLNFFTIWTLELPLLLWNFSTWRFHQSYSMILYGCHRVGPTQVENEELLFRNAIECGTVELILWNLMAKYQRQSRMELTLHPSYNSLGWCSPPSWLRSNSSLFMPFGLALFLVVWQGSICN